MPHEGGGSSVKGAILAIKELSRHIRKGRTRRDGIDEDALGSKLDCHGSGQVNNRCFGGNEGALQPQCGEADGGSDIDDSPPTLSDHRLNDGSTHKISPVEIDADDPVPFLDRKRIDIDPVRQRIDARIIHEDINPAIGCQCLVQATDDLGFTTDIESDSNGAGQFAGNLPGPGFIDIGNCDRRAVRSQKCSNSLTDATGCAGNEGHLPGQICSHEDIDKAKYNDYANIILGQS